MSYESVAKNGVCNLLVFKNIHLGLLNDVKNFSVYNLHLENI